MSLEPPNLDDRSYDQIRDELLRRIPRYTPEWTDWNESDPGVAMIELFAWLAESIGYRLNQAPDRCLLTFLETLDITPEPAQAARADLTFVPQDKVSTGVLVPAHTPVASDVQTDDGPIVFETERELGLIPFKLVSVRAGGPGGFSDVNLDRPPFEPFGQDPQPGNALYFGFEPMTEGGSFPAMISVLVDPSEAPPANAGRVSAAPSTARLVWEYPTPRRWRSVDAAQPHRGRLPCVHRSRIRERAGTDEQHPP